MDADLADGEAVVSGEANGAVLALSVICAAPLGQLTRRHSFHCAANLTHVAEHENDAAIDPIALCTACENAKSLGTTLLQCFWRQRHASASSQIYPGVNTVLHAR